MPEEAIVKFYAPGEANQVLLNLDGILLYDRSLFVTPSQAAWRLLSYPLHDHSHSVQRLAVHKPHNEHIFFLLGEEGHAMEHHVGTTLSRGS